MDGSKVRIYGIIFALISFAAAVCGQKQFEGYSFSLDANDSASCSITWLPSSGGMNVIDVYVAGTNLQTPAGNLKACGGGAVRGNQVTPNGYGKWCFTGSEDMYEIKLKNGASYLWPALTSESGFYNVKDFRPVTYYPQSAVKYEHSEPADYTKTIRNAIQYIAARQGGTLYFPDGDYVVGTLDGSRRDPDYNAITLPSGIIVQGTTSSQSTVGSDMPYKTVSTRIRLRNENQSIFRIGGCTNNITIKNLELVGNSELLGEAKRSNRGNYGIEAMGKWTVDPRTGAEASNTSQIFRFESLTLQNLDRAIYVHNSNEDRCNEKEQRCTSWQFDYVKVDHVNFVNNGTGIWVNTFNSDWKITNAVFNYLANFAPPGDGIRLQRSGSVLIEHTFGGGGSYDDHIGGTFLNIDFATSITLISSGSERGKRSIYTNPAGSVSSVMITVVGGGFSDKVELHGRVNFISNGNVYGARTIQADPEVLITSTGDRFCQDPNVLPSACVEAGKFVTNPGITGGRVMFQTGRPPEGSGTNRIEGRPNLFGYNVQIADGLMQYDPNITFRDITAWATGSDGRPKVSDGAFLYCKDCRRGSSGICTQGNAGTDGSFVKRVNGQWRCD
ncbi:MAG: hypothetical protein ACR2IH_06850 [Pyrinomonadaceae bacterium]